MLPMCLNYKNRRIKSIKDTEQPTADYYDSNFSNAFGNNTAIKQVEDFVQIEWLKRAPPEILLMIFKFVKYEDFNNLLAVNHYFRKMILENSQYLIHLRIKYQVKPFMLRTLIVGEEQTSGSSNDLSDPGTSDNINAGNRAQVANVSQGRALNEDENGASILDDELENNARDQDNTQHSQSPIFIDPPTRRHLLHHNTFLQRVLLTKFPNIYAEALYNRFVSHQLVLLKFLNLRTVKMHLSIKLSQRPSRKQLLDRGILKRCASCTAVSIQIKVLKKNLIEDVLQNLVNSYRYNMCLVKTRSHRRSSNAGAEGDKDLVTSFPTSSRIRKIVERLSQNLDGAGLSRSKSVVEEISVLQNIKVQNKKLFFEEMNRESIS